jgi:hypothetical protein
MGAGIEVTGLEHWDGYVAVNTANSNATEFNAVSAHWTVTPITCDPTEVGPQFASFWVGFDGWHNGSVEQDGITAACSQGQTTPEYFAWWEMFPFNSEIAVTPPVTPERSPTRRGRTTR